MQNNTRDLFQLQSELVDRKVEMVTSQAINRVIDQITSLRQDMHTQINQLRDEMNSRFSSLENRVVALETKLGIISDKKREIRNHFIDYSFKAGWMFLGAIIASLVPHFHSLF